MRFRFVAHQRALDFANTLQLDHGGLVDRLSTFDDVLSWLEESGTLVPRQVADALAFDPPGRAAEALHVARELRQAIRSMADAFVYGEPVTDQAVQTVNARLAFPVRVREIVRHAAAEGLDRFELRSHLSAASPLDLLVPVAEAAADLLCRLDPDRVRRCAHPSCGLYFLDTTKNASRRWCDMATCGNRANVAAHYRRRRTTILS